MISVHSRLSNLRMSAYCLHGWLLIDKKFALQKIQQTLQK